MVRFMRSAQFKRGKGVFQWARETSDYINIQYPETQIHVFTARFGAANTIYWMADFEDFAALERWQAQVGSDAGYRELRRKSIDTLIEGSIFDTVMVPA
jgi:hypothetical protein